ncbi:hypothetical protein ACFOLC_06535 [Lysobacter cavernae]|uniref:Peptidase M61 catalytic domain-containing protein n=1 Tax=Lysobacter cavernae TaxID=1685901 RepID=A0ABV7RPX1_9GAMM
MGRPWLLLLALAAALNSSAAEPGGSSAYDNERLLRADGGVLRVHVIDAPSPARADELQRWLAGAAEAMLTAYGRFPLPEATVRIEQSQRRSTSPVPWGQTLRRDGVSVLLYVRGDAGYAELRDDWTAVHELAHLFHPYLGDDGRWLAEGLASYYQNVLRARAGLLTPEQAWDKLDAGFGRGRRENSGAPLDEISRRHRGTMRVYWAGAAYWLEADLSLRRHGSNLDTVLSQYARCCLHGTGAVRPQAFVAELDRIAGGDDFQRRWRRYAASREFPSLDASYTALGLEPVGDGLRFSDRRDAVRLRQAITGPRPARTGTGPATRPR